MSGDADGSGPPARGPDMPGRRTPVGGDERAAAAAEAADLLGAAELARLTGDHVDHSLSGSLDDSLAFESVHDLDRDPPPPARAVPAGSPGWASRSGEPPDEPATLNLEGPPASLRAAQHSMAVVPIPQVDLGDEEEGTVAEGPQRPAPWSAAPAASAAPARPPALPMPHPIPPAGSVATPAGSVLARSGGQRPTPPAIPGVARRGAESSDGLAATATPSLHTPAGVLPAVSGRRATLEAVPGLARAAAPVAVALPVAADGAAAGGGHAPGAGDAQPVVVARAVALPPASLLATAQRPIQRPAVARPISVVAPDARSARRPTDGQLSAVSRADRSEPTHQPMLAPARRLAPAKVASPMQVSVPAPRAAGSGELATADAPSVILDFADEAEHPTQIFGTDDRPDRPRGRLVLTGGPDDGKTWYLNRAQTTVGRSVDNDIVLVDTAVSRRHFRVERTGQGFRLADEGSGNGTWLNGQRASRDELFDGDRIMAGDSVLVFTTVGGVRPRPSTAERATDPGRRIGPVTPAAPRASRVPLSWIVAWMLTTLAAVAVTVTVVRTVRQRRAAEARTAAEAHREEAVTAVARRDWGAARSALVAAREADPRLLDYADELRQLARAAADGEAVERAQTALEARDPAGAEEAVRGIDGSSRYIFEARQMRNRAQLLRLNLRVEEGRTALARGRAEVARLIAEEVLAVDAGHREARALLEAARQP